MNVIPKNPVATLTECREPVISRIRTSMEKNNAAKRLATIPDSNPAHQV